MRTKNEFEEAVRLYADMLYRIAFSYLKSAEDANDVVQETLIQLYVLDKDFASQEHIRSWLIRVTINRCKKVFRAPWHKREDMEDYANTLFYEQPDYLDLYTSLMRLDKKYRLPLILFYCEGYSTKEIAALLELPEKTVSTRLSRGKRKLRDSLKEDDL